MSELETTRLSLHAVAELLLAGPQYEVSRTIRLQPTPGGFGTSAEPALRVAGTVLVVGDREVDLHGHTVTEVARVAGLEARSLADVFTDGCGLGVDHRLAVDSAAAAVITEAFRRGNEALTALAPDEAKVLWPEHFDVAVTLDQVNYGVSPGDSYLAVPYAYVGPWSTAGLEGAFWNAPFGAAAPLSELDDLLAFFNEGKQEVAAHG